MLDTMDINFVGAFVFINQGYGILSSIYHNIVVTEPYPETAKKIRDHSPDNYPGDLFHGIYKTIWWEDKTHDSTELEITRQQNGTYTLTWYDKKGTYYKGLGFLRNNELIGSYWKP